jgi:hypothetical protein
MILPLRAILWKITISENGAGGFRVTLTSHEQTASGNGATVAAAFHACEVKFVRKPPLFPFGCDCRTCKS